MKKIYSLIAIIMAVTLTFSSVGAVFAAEERELTNDEKAAFIVRDEWTGWVRDFTASLSELDKNATAKIYEGMDLPKSIKKFLSIWMRKENQLRSLKT